MTEYLSNYIDRLQKKGKNCESAMTNLLTRQAYLEQQLQILC